jgi:hypothetical protein
VQIKVTLTDIERNGGHDAFVIACPLNHDVRVITGPMVRAVREAVGGMPVVAAAIRANGDLHTFGRAEHTQAVIEEGLDGRSWALFDVPVASARPRRGLRRLSPELAVRHSVRRTRGPHNGQPAA